MSAMRLQSMQRVLLQVLADVPSVASSELPVCFWRAKTCSVGLHRPCIKCQKPGHEPWKCPTKNIVRIINREFPPHILVDCRLISQPSARVSYVDLGHQRDSDNSANADGFANDNNIGNDDDWYDSSGDYASNGFYVDEHAADDASFNVSALCESDRPVDAGEADHLVDTDGSESGGMQIAEVVDEARVNAVGTSDKLPRVSVREAIERGFLGSMTLRASIIYYVNLIPSCSELKGAVLVDSGAQIGLDNDITMFIG